MTEVNEKLPIKEEPEPLDILLKTMEKYVKNKKNCSPEDLKGKYGKSFQALKAKLAQDTKKYLQYAIFGSLYWEDSEHGRKAMKKAQAILDEMEIGKRAGKAVFTDMNIDALIDLAQSARNRIVTEAWWPYQMRTTA